MATKTISTVIDDLDGSDATSTITFSYDSTNYSIDLNDANAKVFRDVLKPYTKAATIVGARRSTGGGVKTEKSELDAARTWLRANGHEVSDRGRIKGDLMDLYRSSK